MNTLTAGSVSDLRSVPQLPGSSTPPAPRRLPSCFSCSVWPLHWYVNLIGRPLCFAWQARPSVLRGIDKYALTTLADGVARLPDGCRCASGRGFALVKSAYDIERTLDILSG